MSISPWVWFKDLFTNAATKRVRTQLAKFNEEFEALEWWEDYRGSYMLTAEDKELLGQFKGDDEFVLACEQLVGYEAWTYGPKMKLLKNGVEFYRENLHKIHHKKTLWYC